MTDDDLEQKSREILKALANPSPELQERLRKAFTDPTCPLFLPTFLRQLQTWDDLYLKVIQSPVAPGDVIALAKEGREYLAEAMRAARNIQPSPPRVSKPLRRR
jgi:hypothetical protein